MDTPAEPTFIPFFMLLAFFLFVYFVTIRPQQKRRKEHETLVASLQKGDEVMTSSGLVGRVETVSCLLYTSPSPRDKRQSRMPSSA